MTKTPSKELLDTNAETGKFYLEAVLNRIKKLEADKQIADYTVYLIFQEIKAVLGEHGLRTVQERFERNTNYGVADTYWNRFMEFVNAGGKR